MFERTMDFFEYYDIIYEFVGDSMSVKEDIQLARKVMVDPDSANMLYYDCSYIHKCTNENMNSPAYIEQLRDRRDILTVIGSGDQVLNSILLGSENIDAFDISRFPKYFLGLKIAAIKVLTYDEFIAFFFNYKKSFPRNLYKKVVSTMDGELKEFWSKIASPKLFTTNYSPRSVYFSGLFVNDQDASLRAIKLNPYLNERNYYLLKKKIDNVRINCLTGNIMNLGDQINKRYDFINLSNIYMYQLSILMDEPDCHQEEKYKHFVKNLQLNPDGRIISYLKDYVPGSLSYNFIQKYYSKDKDFIVHPIEGVFEGTPDALLIYKK